MIEIVCFTRPILPLSLSLFLHLYRIVWCACDLFALCLFLKRISSLRGPSHLSIASVCELYVCALTLIFWNIELFNANAVNERYLLCVKLEHDQATDHNSSPEIKKKKHVDFLKHEKVFPIIR